MAGSTTGVATHCERGANMRYESETAAVVVDQREARGMKAVERLLAQLQREAQGEDISLVVAERILEEVRLGHLEAAQARWMLRGYLEGSVMQAFRLGADRGQFSDFLRTEVKSMLDLVTEPVDPASEFAPKTPEQQDADRDMRARAAHLRDVWAMRTT
jgi:hypothetical protein